MQDEDMGAVEHKGQSATATAGKQDGVTEQGDKRLDAFAKKHNLSKSDKASMKNLFNTMLQEAKEDTEDTPSLNLVGKSHAKRQWGEEEEEEETDNISLFIDLVYVGVCFSLGDMLHEAFYECKMGEPEEEVHLEEEEVHFGRRLGLNAIGLNTIRHRGLEEEELPCVGLAVGLGHVFVFYQVLFTFWVFEALWRSHYVALGKFKYLFEAVLLFGLIGAASSVTAIQKLQEIRVWWFWFCFWSMLILVTWAVRYLLIVVRSKAANERSESTFVLVTLACQMAILASAWGCACFPDVEGTYDAMMALLVIFPFCWPLCNLVNRLIHFLNHTPELSKEAMKAKTTPFGSRLFAQRVHEFMMLMLGEAVLQLVIAPWPTGSTGEGGEEGEEEGDVHGGERRLFDHTVPEKYSTARGLISINDEQKVFMVAIAAGLLIALSLMHAHVESDPSPGSVHCASKGNAGFLIFVFLSMLKGMSIMLVGHGIEFILHAPTALSEFPEEKALAQRAQLGMALSSTFFMSLLLKMVHDGPITFWAPVVKLESVILTTCTLVRVGVTMAMWATCWVELQPWRYLLMQMGFCLIGSLCIHINKYVRHYYILPLQVTTTTTNVILESSQM